MHAEAIAPVGGTVLILDGGPDRVAVSWVRERVAFVGAPDPAVLGRLLGVRAGLPELVGALLEGPAGLGAAGAGLRVEREGAPGRLPQRLVVSSDDGRIELERRDLRPAPADTAALGRGDALEGFDVRPLAAMLDLPLPDELRAPEGR